MSHCSHGNYPPTCAKCTQALGVAQAAVKTAVKAGADLFLSKGDQRVRDAAPELLEALYAALPLVEDAAVFMKDDFKPGYLSGLVETMREAIAKAEGR